MANEFRHGTVGTELTQAEYEAITGHAFDSQATGDLLYASSATQLSRLAIATADTQYLTKAGGVPAWGASGQIVFPATQNASADANTLDDYEEGTWTLVVAFGGGTTGQTSSANTGRYTKVGRQVTLSGTITLTAKGSSVGDAAISGLPFTIGGTGDGNSAVGLVCNTVTFVGMMMGMFEPAEGRCTLYEITEAGVRARLNETDFANTSQVIIGGSYSV